MVPRPTASQTPHRGPACWVRKRRKTSLAWVRVFCLVQGQVRLDPLLEGSDAATLLVAMSVLLESLCSGQERWKIGTHLVLSFC